MLRASTIPPSWITVLFKIGQASRPEKEKRDITRMSRCFLYSTWLELKLQRELNDSRRFSGLDNSLGRGWRHAGTAGLRKNGGSDARRADRSIARIVKVDMVQRIEQFGP